MTNWGKYYYKLGQFCFNTNWGSFILLQIEAAFFITNWGKLNYYKSGQLLLQKSGQLLQIRATVITNWGSYYKLEQSLLQIGSAITNWVHY